MYVNDSMILELIALLKSHGVHHFVVSPGSRHYPIVRSLEAEESFTLYSVVDERSAGFFAIGLIQAVGNPVAVITTSGTASVNLGSSVAEAYYQGLPLLAVTADRLPELLDQMEDQMVDQQSLFIGMVRQKVQLKPVASALDRWHNNRSVNSALLALTRNGGGPVHINVPVARHTGLAFNVQQLPNARVIRHHSPVQDTIDWQGVANRLRGKRVMVLWGQGMPPSSELLTELDHFVESTNSAVFADHLGNLHHHRVVPRAFVLLGAGHTNSSLLAPDIVISVRGNMFLMDRLKSFFDKIDIEHWRVDPDGEIEDPFWQLTDVFQTSPQEFFERVCANADRDVPHDYFETAHALSRALPGPSPAFGELAAIGTFLSSLPPDSVLHIANSAPIRMAHLFVLDPSIIVLGNRGVNGIDGSMSSSVGFAAASTKLVFLVLGDLSFFYDMNSLWIRNTPSRLRILLLNNGGGALMHSNPIPPALAIQGARHISAEHSATARGWVESQGLMYHSASNEDEFQSGLMSLLDESGDRAVVLEVFTEKVNDIKHLRDYHRAISEVGDNPSPYRRARRMAGKALRRMGLHS